MATGEFRRGVAELLALARERPTAAMCAEMLPWRCHRSFLADHLVLVEGARVLHVLDERPAEEHVPRPEASVRAGVVAYEKTASGATSGRSPSTRRRRGSAKEPGQQLLGLGPDPAPDA
jgi:hypothetical protein